MGGSDGWPVLRLCTVGRCQIDTSHLLDVFAGQRRRFTHVLRGFAPGDWTAPTRCPQWSAQDVVRHLSDCNEIVLGISNQDFNGIGDFDPRITPDQWLKASKGESPAETLERFTSTTTQVLGIARGWLAEGRRFDVPLPYGPMDWTVLILHGFWDSWVHERDVRVASGAEHSVGDAATRYATAYGLFFAAVVSAYAGDPVTQRLNLTGEGGGTFDIRSGQAVTLSATPGSATGPSAAQVTDALGGRGQADASLPVGLSRLGVFFNTPIALAPMNALPSPKIITARLELHEYGPGDGDLVAEAIASGEPEALPPGIPGDSVRIANWLARDMPDFRDRGAGVHLAMVSRETGKLIGSIGIFHLDWEVLSGEIGYGVRSDQRRSGYATEALAGVSAWVLTEGGLQRAWLTANTDNMASVRVAEKAGFHREGTLRRAGIEDDGLHDQALFSLLDSDIRE